MKKKLSLLLSALLLLGLLAGCGGSDNSGSGGGTPSPSGNLTFTTGGDQGTYYALGSVLAGQVSASTDTKVTAITSGGSQANILALSDGDAQLGFVQSDVMSYAYTGTNLFNSPVPGFSTVAALYTEQVQIVTLDPNLTSVADLAGKTVSVGDAGSGTYFNAVDILNAYGIDAENDINPVYESFGTSADSLQDGKIDAAFVVAGAPTNAITSLAASKTVYLISLDDDHINALIASSPYYTRNVIPAATYNLPADVTTVAVGAVVVARDDASEDDVYNFVSGVFENLDAVASSHAKGAELNLDFAASVTSVPYHPGAARYFAEKGFDVPTK
ncbi:MAG: TAXI family TRAP transporter solute-binding subunit [Oscillibacter sp.]|nr:TAXI family TRAP transporter solute-binding subunit [Oscillibacter sp.]MBQ9618045.1 TAXI family TRAP transporter solute-binding subunit [Oscillibacter sp.]